MNVNEVFRIVDLLYCDKNIEKEMVFCVIELVFVLVV